jgi:hypothetical protein
MARARPRSVSRGWRASNLATIMWRGLYHPNQPLAWRVELGLLGDQATQPNGVNTAPIPSALPSAGNVFGAVIAGPTSPVQRARQTCPPRPVVATVDANGNHGATVVSTHTDSSDRYAVSLPSGAYTLVVVTGAAWPRRPDTPVVVHTGRATCADIQCDSGIR